MKSSLGHLPEAKRAILRDIVAVLREGAPVEMLILFGSHALDAFRAGFANHSTKG